MAISPSLMTFLQTRLASRPQALSALGAILGQRRACGKNGRRHNQHTGKKHRFSLSLSRVPPALAAPAGAVYFRARTVTYVTRIHAVKQLKLGAFAAVPPPTHQLPTSPDVHEGCARTPVRQGPQGRELSGRVLRDRSPPSRADPGVLRIRPHRRRHFRPRHPVARRKSLRSSTGSRPSCSAAATASRRRCACARRWPRAECPRSILATCSPRSGWT